MMSGSGDESRAHNRVMVSPCDLGISGKFTVETERDDVTPFNVIDISKQGVGIWSPSDVRVGREVAIDFGCGVQTKGRVIWCSTIEDDFGYRIGIQALEEDTHLEAFHQLTGEVA